MRASEVVAAAIGRLGGVADHLVPNRGDERLFCDESSWQSL